MQENSLKHLEAAISRKRAAVLKKALVFAKSIEDY